MTACKHNTFILNYPEPVRLSFDPEHFLTYLCASLLITHSFFEFTFVPLAVICDLHKTRLNDASETDIITFNLTESPTPSTSNLIGDIYICPDVAHRHARELNHSLDIEMQTLITHGILHILGYDDQTTEDRNRMFAKQDQLVATYQ
ncbi:MAG: rRNA maturation RNase YbeY [Planctomycetes bacterium]|nr:rRNA maturation RNase YbeY [Planctomycetota bacterium]|tara:strand:+ start:358 stop:798 length:441 start_codon:yes stop_codon:yes gene_type:complete